MTGTASTIGKSTADLLDEVAREFPEAQSLVSFEAGSVIFAQDEIGDCAYLVERGSVRVARSFGGRERTLITASPGDLFGELCLLENNPRAATATALTDCELLVVRRGQIQREVANSPAIVKVLVRVLLERLKMLSSLSASQGDTVTEVGAAEANIGQDTTQLKAVHEIRLERQLREAIAKREFELHYQPIVSLKTRKLTGFEALIRWMRPDEGLVYPDRFIASAERSGLIVPIGLWVLEEASHFANRLHARLRQDNPAVQLPFVSVNVSPLQLESADGVSRMLSAMADTGVDCERIKLEITENVLIENPETSAAALKRLKETGVTLAVDDFGTGYASLSYLPRYPLDTMKIDRSFVMDLGERGSEQVIQSMVLLARNLDMNIVAEGVETKEQMARLEELGCDHGQGYLFAKPMSEERVMTLAQRSLDARQEGRPVT